MASAQLKDPPPGLATPSHSNIDNDESADIPSGVNIENTRICAVAEGTMGSTRSVVESLDSSNNRGDEADASYDAVSMIDNTEDSGRLSVKVALVRGKPRNGNGCLIPGSPVQIRNLNLDMLVMTPSLIALVTAVLILASVLIQIALQIMKTSIRNQINQLVKLKYLSMSQKKLLKMPRRALTKKLDKTLLTTGQCLTINL
jgi:hypothetical protein